MGIPLPPDWPAIEPDLWYCVSLHFYSSFPPGRGCSEYGGDYTGCVSGKDIIDWTTGPGPCSDVGLVDIPLFNNQRIFDIAGPYGLLADCLADCS